MVHIYFLVFIFIGVKIINQAVNIKCNFEHSLPISLHNNMYFPLETVKNTRVKFILFIQIPQQIK
jgi:hypothetical protein